MIAGHRFHKEASESKMSSPISFTLIYSGRDEKIWYKVRFFLQIQKEPLYLSRSRFLWAPANDLRRFEQEHSKHGERKAWGRDWSARRPLFAGDPLRILPMALRLLARCCPPPYRTLVPLPYRDVVIPLPAKVVSDVGARRQRCGRAYSSIGTKCVLLFATIVCWILALL